MTEKEAYLTAAHKETSRDCFHETLCYGADRLGVSREEMCRAYIRRYGDPAQDKLTGQSLLEEAERTWGIYHVG